MKLKQLIKGIDSIEIRGSKEVEILGLSSDSRSAAPGHLFLAKKGAAFDGAQFIQEAIEGGAVAILSDVYDPFLSITQLICPVPE